MICDYPARSSIALVLLTVCISTIFTIDRVEAEREEKCLLFWKVRLRALKAQLFQQ